MVTLATFHHPGSAAPTFTGGSCSPRRAGTSQGHTARIIRNPGCFLCLQGALTLPPEAGSLRWQQSALGPQKPPHLAPCAANVAALRIFVQPIILPLGKLQGRWRPENRETNVRGHLPRAHLPRFVTGLFPLHTTPAQDRSTEPGPKPADSLPSAPSYPRPAHLPNPHPPTPLTPYPPPHPHPREFSLGICAAEASTRVLSWKRDYGEGEETHSLQDFTWGPEALPLVPLPQP